MFDSYLRTHEATDSDMEMLVRKMKEGNVNALMIWNVNPAYTWYNRDAFSKGLKKVGLTFLFPVLLMKQVNLFSIYVLITIIWKLE